MAAPLFRPAPVPIPASAAAAAATDVDKEQPDGTAGAGGGWLLFDKVQYGPLAIKCPSHAIRERAQKEMIDRLGSQQVL